MKHICKNCMQFYDGKPEVCPFCGAQLRVSKKIEEPQSSETKENKVKNKRKRFISSKEIMAEISFDELLNRTNDTDVKSWRDKRKKNQESPQVSVDENGELYIDTRDVTYLPETHTYSVKKARGEYVRPKIKWWEIYKWADLMFARRKIKKQVKRAGQYRPEPIKKGSLLTLCIILGWAGLHNFYARNHRKGWFVLIACIFGSICVFNPVFKAVQVSLGGGLMFVVLLMWLFDIIDIIFNKYQFRLSKWRFIDELNVDTRAKLGMKYLDKDEYKKPWIVRMFNKIVKAIKNKKAEKKANENLDKIKKDLESALQDEGLTIAEDDKYLVRDIELGKKTLDEAVEIVKNKSKKIESKDELVYETKTTVINNQKTNNTKKSKNSKTKVIKINKK